MDSSVRLGEWGIHVIPDSGELEIIAFQDLKPLARILGDRDEGLERALLIAAAPTMREALRASYWLIRTLGEKDSRMNEVADEFLPTLESSLHTCGGVGPRPEGLDGGPPGDRVPAGDSGERDQLLEDWFRRVRQSQHYHHRAANHFSKRDAWLGIPAIGLSAVVGTWIFASWGAGASDAIRTGLGLLSLLASVSGILHSSLHLAQRAERHRQSATRFGSLRKRLELIASESRAGRAALDDFDHFIREYEVISQTAPEVPRAIRGEVLGEITQRSIFDGEE